MQLLYILYIYIYICIYLAWGLPTSGEEESHKMMDAFLAAGGNFIDTANVYGDSEEVIGR